MKIFYVISLWLCLASSAQSKQFVFIRLGDTTSISEQYNRIRKDEKVDTFIVPFVSNTYWETGVLVLRSKQTFLLDSGVIIHAQKNCFPNPNTSYGLFRLNNIDDVHIKGENALIDLGINEYKDGEWRHAFFMEGVNNFTMSGITIKGAAGDGICINWNSARLYSEHIVLQNLVFEDNARQGISVISAKNLLIENCVFKNTGRSNHHQLAAHGPWCGIDLEPDSVMQRLENITIKNCTFENNKGDGLLIAFAGGLNRVVIKECTFKDNNRSAIALIGPVRGSRGSFNIQDIDISGKHTYGFYIRDWTYTKQQVLIDDVNIIGEVSHLCWFGSTEKSDTMKLGNIRISNVRLGRNMDGSLIEKVGKKNYSKTKLKGTMHSNGMSSTKKFSLTP
jgi:hypothetical protein